MSSMGDGAVSAGPGRRDQLLSAARDVLAKNGYERTTVSSIATKANVAQGTFYLYFPSKEALPGALAEQLSAAMGEVADNAANAPSFDDGVSSLVEGSFRAAEQFSDVLLIANRGIELCEDWAGWLHVTAAWREGLENFVRHFQTTGEVDASIDVPTTCYLVRDILDRASKARVLFRQPGYADATVKLLRGALAA
jgi:AcrR family transcriptional regulator